jgi:hypothetical protein
MGSYSGGAVALGGGKEGSTLSRRGARTGHHASDRVRSDTMGPLPNRGRVVFQNGLRKQAACHRRATDRSMHLRHFFGARDDSRRDHDNQLTYNTEAM